MTPARPNPQVAADFFGCPADVLRNGRLIERALVDAARAAGARVLDRNFHSFPGGGVTGVVSLAESHLAIHTWPEEGYAAIDVFMCGRADAEEAVALLKGRLGASRWKISKLARGEPARRVVPVRDAPAARIGRRGSMAMLTLMTLIVAACSLVYELLLAQTLSALLGDTVLRYSLTVGCYLGALGLGAMLCERQPASPWRRLVRIELALSAVGGAAVPLLYLLDALQRYEYFFGGAAGTAWAPLAFLAAAHLLIVVIGVLSGFELPLLLAIGEHLKPRSTNRILGVDYLGALIGSVLFPLFLLRHMGLLAGGFLAATLNAVACLVMVRYSTERRPRIMTMAVLAVTCVLVVGLAASSRLEQFFLRKFYYPQTISSLGGVFRAFPELPRIERYRSSYQTIDIVRSGSPHQWLFSLLSTKSEEEDDYPLDVRLYIDRAFQLFSGTDEYYHEWFVHVPIQANGHPPRSALVLGGGDGVLVRELLHYDTLERLVHVELDPVMIRLAAEHPLLSRLNSGIHADPRLVIVQDDAFRWLRTHGEMFDAIYIDMPYPRSYGLSKVFSREFYSMARSHLSDDGFLAMDAPDGDCRLGHVEGSLWPIYDSTLSAAGFETVIGLTNILDTDDAALSARIGAIAAEGAAVVRREGATGELATEAAFRETIESGISQNLSGFQDFILAFPGRRTPATAWKEMGVPLRALKPSYLDDALQLGCEHHVRPELVNSIFRPTLPLLWFGEIPSA